jgi:ABC-type branched-subunit amino acid transport system substrate-binding protein
VRRYLLSSLVLILFVAFHASLANAAMSDYAAREELGSILKGIELGGPNDSAVKSLESFIYKNPRVSVGDEALFRLADIFMERKDFESASKAYQELLFKFPDSRFTIESLYGLGYCRYRFGQLSAATVTLENLVSNPSVSLLLKVKASILLDQIYSVASTFEEIDGGGEGLAIGAILPLEGDYAEFGERALKGILLAANAFGNGGGSGEPVEVYVRELGEERGAAKMVVYELARLKRVQAIVGLLLREAAPEVAKRAQQRRIPLLALSQREGLPRTGSYVFRSFMTLSKQAETLAKYAYDVKEFRRFAILSPRNTYGRKLAEAFKGEVHKLGGEIVGENTYVVGKSDFAVELKELFLLETFERLEGRRLIRESTPGVEVDALFIPDNYDAVAQIAPYLAFYGLQDVALLGSNGWNSPFLTELAEEHVDGSVFVDGFFAKSVRDETKDFVELFKRVYGYEPGLLEAESYDAAMLLLLSMETGDGYYQGRSALRDRLISADLYHGATGDIYFDASGEASKELFLLTVEEGEIKEVVLPVQGDEGTDALDMEVLGEPGTDGEMIERETIRILDYLLNPEAETGDGAADTLDDEPLPVDDLILGVEEKPVVKEEKKKKKPKSRRRRRKRTWDEEDDFDADLF